MRRRHSLSRILSGLPFTNTMFKPNALAVVRVCAVLMAVSTLVNAQAVASGNSRAAPFPKRETETEIFDLVNRQRARVNRSQLDWDERIAGVARAYSERMAREKFFDHYDPQGKAAVDRAAKVPGWHVIGENLFMSELLPSLSGFVVKSWMGSTSHQTNMLDPRWTATGIGIGRAANGDVYITQLFTRK